MPYIWPLIMSKQLAMFPDGMMQNVILNQLQAQLTVKENIIEKQRRIIAAYKGHNTKRKNK